MTIITTLAIAFVSAAAAAVNGLVGAIFLFIIWIWLHGGVIPMVGPYLRQEPQYAWAPHLLLPLIVFLLVWQWKLRGKIGPQWGIRELVQRIRTRNTYA
jgi:uncharacterized membrane protein